MVSSFCLLSNIIEINLPSTSGTSSTRDEAKVTREVLATLDNSYQSEFNHSFTVSVVKHCGKSEGIVLKENRTEKKSKFRILQRKFVSSISDTFAKKAAISFFYLKTSHWSSIKGKECLSPLS